MSDKIREKSIDLIRPRYLQISKELKVKDLKDKIKRCIKDFHDSNAPIKLYLFSFGLKEKKKETFEMIYAYSNKYKNHKVAAEEVKDDEVLMEVNIINNLSCRISITALVIF